jgi:hypothetical protein
MRVIAEASILLAIAKTIYAGNNDGTAANLISDTNIISRHLGQVSSYHDNPADQFGVDYVGLPCGCQVEQAHSLQRHAQRFPTGSVFDGDNNERFASKVLNFTTANSAVTFNGPLDFLNGYRYPMTKGLLTGLGAKSEFLLGVTFWNRYGRTLFNASVGQLAYNASFPNGTARPQLVIRSTDQSRIENSAINWALGFFGPSYEPTPNPTLANATKPFTMVYLPEEDSTSNNTLASYISCANDNEDIGYIGDNDIYQYIPIYLQDATARMQQYAPSGFTFTTNDTFAMQSICAYEIAYIGMSDFCSLFTLDEWLGFEQTLSIDYYYDYSYGNPTGRAQGLGYAQELLARLKHQYITVSNSSVNSTLDSSSASFPTNQPFYLDFTHDDIIISLLTAMSVDYFYNPPSLTEYPPGPNRTFVLSRLTPFGANLITEVIGCKDQNPEPVQKQRTQYTPGQYGYDPNNAPYKFVRMRLNNGILPLDSIRGGLCAGREDGLCDLGSFIQSQADIETLANYQYACFGNYSIAGQPIGADYDGTISE